MRAMAAGAADLARLAPPAGVTVLVFAQTFVRGALTVLLVVLALDVLLLGEAAVGWLTAAMGIGGLVGGAVAGATLTVTRLARGFVAGLLLWGIPLAVLAAAPSPLTAYLALGVVGVGNAVEDVSLFTLMPRAFRPRFVGRALGALELTVFAGIGLGSIMAPLLVESLGVRGALGGLGGGLTALAVLYAFRFIRLDADLPVPGPEADLLRRNPIFAPLPLATVELLATQLSPHRFEAGEVVMAEGEIGDRFHLIAEGIRRRLGGRRGPGAAGGGGGIRRDRTAARHSANRDDHRARAAAHVLPAARRVPGCHRQQQAVRGDGSRDGRRASRRGSGRAANRRVGGLKRRTDRALGSSRHASRHLDDLRRARRRRLPDDRRLLARRAGTPGPEHRGAHRLVGGRARVSHLDPRVRPGGRAAAGRPSCASRASCRQLALLLFGGFLFGAFS